MPHRMLLYRCAAIVAIGGGGLLYLNHIAPWQWPTVFVYTGLVVAMCGLACVVWPPKWLGVRRRADAALAVGGGAALLAAGLFWPAGTHRSPGNTGHLDALLPVYDFHERHELRVHATPERTAAAFRQATFNEIGVMRTLAAVRGVAMGRPVHNAPPAPSRPIVELIANGRTGFFPLGGNEREFVFGMAGQPWNNGGQPARLTAAEFPAWAPPGNVKIVANLRVEDAGNGWSLLSTETRIAATNDEARRTMARYWRLIYPGSGMIRRSLLEAIQARAER